MIGPMKLRDYLIAERLTEAAFADLIGISQPSVNALCTGSVPNPKTAAAIVTATGGLVTPNDFYGVEPVVKRRDAPKRRKKRDPLALLDDDKGFSG